MKIDVKKVIKRDGRVVDFDLNRIRNAIQKAMMSVNKYDEKTLNKVVRYVVKVLNEKYGAEDIPHVEDIQDIVEFALVRYDLYEVAKAYILYRKEREKIRKEKMLILNKDYLDEVDKAFSLNAIRLLAARYLLKDSEGKVIESPKQLFQRVAMLVVIPDILYDPSVFDKNGRQPIHPYEEFKPEEWEYKVGLGYKPEEGGFKVYWNRYHLQKMKELYDRLNQEKKMKVPWNQFFNKLSRGEFDKYYDNYLDYYNLMVSKKFMPNSPTLFNAGTRLGQLSACFVLAIDDDIESIMKAASDAAKIFKTGGGIGINYSKLRPEGDIVSSTAGVASGPVSFMRIIDTVTDVIKQGGRRRGANMGILEIWHPDIEKFITCKSKPGVLENFNISVLVTPDFWEAYNENKEYPLINPRDGKTWKTVNARQLFRMIAENAWKTGDPGVLFLDNINKRNIMKKTLGEIRSTNPCISGETRVLTPNGWIKARELYQNSTTRVAGVTASLEILADGGEPHPYKTKILTITGKETVYKTHHGDELKLLIPKEMDAWVWHVGVKPGVQIETKEGYSIIVTEEHKFLTPDGWREAKQLSEGDRIMISRIHPEFIANQYRGECRLDKDVAFALGWLVGDGTFNKNYVAWFLGNKDKASENRIRKAIEKLGGNPLSHTYTLSETEYKIQYNKGTKLYKNISNILKNYLERSRERRLPEIVWRLDPEALAAFLRGLFTADGTVDNDKAIRLTSASLNLLKDVQVLLTTFGIFSKIYERPYQRINKYQTKEGEERVYISSGYYELVISGYSRRIFKELIGFEDIDKIEKLSLAKTKRDSIWVTISSVKRIKNMDFYDFTVPIYHTYIANGIVNHNCAEEPLYPYESCNLGSINLYALIREVNGKRIFDWEEYKEVIRLATRFLDNIIDINTFPLPEIKEMTLSTRKIGLGIMGLADTLYALKIPYNSEEGFWLMGRFAEYLTYYSMETSVNLARERGPFPLFDKSAYVDGEMPIEGYYHRDEWTLDWERLNKMILEYGMRNSETTTIAPTGSISMIVDTSSGIEPQFALVFEKRVTVGTFFYIDSELELELKRRGLYSEKLLKKIADNGGSLQDLEDIPEDMKKVFIVAYDIPWWDHVRAQIEISKWISAAVSKTINMPNWVTVDDVEKAYLFAYKLGAKGITIYRDGSKAAQVLVTPSQREGRYILRIRNKTLDMMRKLGIEPPSYATEEAKSKKVEPTLVIPSVISRAGESSGEERYERCPICEGINIVFSEGCIKCIDCGWSACVAS